MRTSERGKNGRCEIHVLECKQLECSDGIKKWETIMRTKVALTPVGNGFIQEKE